MAEGEERRTVLQCGSELCLWADDRVFMTILLFFSITPRCPRDCYHPDLFSLKGPRRIKTMRIIQAYMDGGIHLKERQWI